MSALVCTVAMMKDKSIDRGMYLIDFLSMIVYNSMLTSSFSVRRVHLFILIAFSVNIFNNYFQ
jgi:hypothetical protein